ncbi:hypothetical protein [Gymnodinialimonas sp.]
MKETERKLAYVQSSLSPRCREFLDVLLRLVEQDRLLGATAGGVAGSTLVYTKRGVLPASDLMPDDRLLDHKTGDFVKVVDVYVSDPGGAAGNLTVELPSTDRLSPGRLRVHPSQPIVVSGNQSATYIFGNNRILLPALWAGPFLGGQLCSSVSSWLFRPVTERPILMWTVERPVPCLSPGLTWADCQLEQSFSSLELQKWLMLYGFRVDSFFREHKVAACRQKAIGLPIKAETGPGAFGA